MNATKSLLVSAVSVVALTFALASEAATGSRHGGSGHGRGGGASYGHGGGHGYGQGYGHRYGHRYGGYRYGYGYGGYWRPYYGFYLAAPFVFGASYAAWDPYWGYWGSRYPYPYYRGDASYPDYRYDERMQDGGAGTTEIAPNAQGAPTQAPLYLNYCAEAKAYFPKVTSCPGGWQFRQPSYN
jgi:hypothetical protein